MKKALQILILTLILSGKIILGQSVGDYGTSSTTATWTTPSHWIVCVSPGTWVGAIVATLAPSSSTNCFIRSGCTATVPTSGTVECNNLTVIGTLVSSNNISTPRFLNIYGTTVTINGSFGGPGDGLSLNIYNSNTTLTGSPNPSGFYICRIQPQVATSLTFNVNCYITFIGSGIYCNGLATTYTINAGKTVSLKPGSNFAVGTTVTGDPSIGANLNLDIYGTLTLQSSVSPSVISLANKSGFTTNLHVYETGTLNCGNSMYAYSNGSASAINVTVDNGGSVSFTGTSGVCNIGKATTIMNGTWDYGNVSTGGTTGRSLGATALVDGTIMTKDAFLNASGSAGPYAKGTITLNSNSLVEYYGTSSISGISVSPVENLQVNNSAGVVLANNIVVNGTLYLTGGTITLGSNNLIAGSVSGGSAYSYVLTNGTGGFIRNVGPDDVSFPVGFTDSYTPVVLNNSGNADTFTVKVKNIIDHPTVTNEVVNKQWTITESTPGSADVSITLQWNSGDENSLFLRDHPVYIARYNGTIWNDNAANYTDLGGGGVYTASSDGFTAGTLFIIENIDELPVELSSFTSNCLNGRTIQLNWETKTEKNSNKFIVERKSILTDWEILGSIKASVLSNSPKHYSFSDNKLQSGKYQYRLKMIDNDGSFNYSKIIETDLALPKNFELSQNYPNPFNPSTKINYTLPFDSKVTLEVYNVAGVKIAQLVNEEKPAGYYSVDFNSFSVGNGISSGVYFYRIIAANHADGTNFTSIKKMMVIK
jgi:hypothetical protein